jgi:mono/diheme cytochrome c family protein
MSIFDHDLHAERLESGDGCSACHTNADDPKDLEHAKPCLECHTEMAVPGATIELTNPPYLGAAVGYANAFHSVCIDCHEQRAADPELAKPDLGQCASCHTGAVPELDPMKPDTRVLADSGSNGTEP